MRLHVPNAGVETEPSFQQLGRAVRFDVDALILLFEGATPLASGTSVQFSPNSRIREPSDLMHAFP